VLVSPGGVDRCRTIRTFRCVGGCGPPAGELVPARRAGTDCPEGLTSQRLTFLFGPVGGRGVDAAGGAGQTAVVVADTRARGAGRGGVRRRSRSRRCRGTGRTTRPRPAAAPLVPRGTAQRPRSRGRSPGCRPPCQATRRC